MVRATLPCPVSNMSGRKKSIELRAENPPTVAERDAQESFFAAKALRQRAAKERLSKLKKDVLEALGGRSLNRDNMSYWSCVTCGLVCVQSHRDEGFLRVCNTKDVIISDNLDRVYCSEECALPATATVDDDDDDNRPNRRLIELWPVLRMNASYCTRECCGECIMLAACDSKLEVIREQNGASSPSHQS